jgi:PTH2 family peptidyl-tRNA hydrolase
MSDVKQVIVMRTKYPDGKGGTKGVNKGKMVAQGAHASMKVFFDRGEIVDHDSKIRKLVTKIKGEFVFCIRITKSMVTWINGAFTKICLRVDDEEELLDIYQKARKAKLPVALITDAGRTEFNGVPTKTCLAIGPAEVKEVDKITGHLKPL